ncbi:S-adenosylmethionine decarboxylase related protein, partial [Bacillus sp. MHSD17]|nr:S-adenosylmethionine decarboxylase related protein [Bacillus sp. MHSD17]
MERFLNSLSITLLGSAGGAAKAVLAILNQAIVNEKDPIYETIKNVTFHLV